MPPAASHPAPRHADGRRVRSRGFTLMEATISLLIVSVLLVASLSLVGVSAKSHRIEADEQEGERLAQQLISELVQHAYEEPVDVSTPGTPEPGEDTGDRRNFDDVDDYIGWQRTPPEDRFGAALPGTDGWIRKVLVTWVEPDDLREALTETGLRRIVVIIRSPSGRRTQLSVLRAQTGVSEWSSYERTYVSWAEIDLQPEGPDSRLTTGVSLSNEPRRNLLENGDFEAGAGPWSGNAATLEILSADPHGGRASARLGARLSNNAGIKQTLVDPIENGATYDAEAWVRIPGGSRSVRLRLKITTSSGTFLAQSASGPVGDAWTRVQGRLTPSYTGSVLSREFHVATVTGTEPLEIDDVILLPTR